MTSRFQRNETTIGTPEQLPSSESEAEQWQAANRSFWEAMPMRYDWTKPVGGQKFSKEFYEEIDARFFSDVAEFMPWRSVAFDTLVDFNGLRTQDVLEIGVGSGSHAQLLATHARSFTGIDLTDYAVESTGKRLAVFDLQGDVFQMDAEAMSFPDESFDFVWSWGVIHHSSNTRAILEQVHRVLRPGGLATFMVYHRGWWNYYGSSHDCMQGE